MTCKRQLISMQTPLEKITLTVRLSEEEKGQFDAIANYRILPVTTFLLFPA